MNELVGPSIDVSAREKYSAVLQERAGACVDFVIARIRNERVRNRPRQFDWNRSAYDDFSGKTDEEVLNDVTFRNPPLVQTLILTFYDLDPTLDQVRSDYGNKYSVDSDFMSWVKHSIQRRLIAARLQEEPKNFTYHGARRNPFK